MIDLWGRYFGWTPAPNPEPREDTNGNGYCIDWTRRRLTPAGITTSRCHCLHGETLLVWCGECSADLDALALELLP